MEKNFFLFLIIFAITTNSCKAQLIGNYKYKGDYTTHILKVNSNNTFSYNLNDHLSESITKGYWSIDNDFLKLESNDKYKPYQVSESFDDKIESIKIKITDSDGVIIKGNYVTLNEDQKKYFINDDGIITISNKIEFESFYIYAIQGKYNYIKKRKKSNQFNVTYDSSEPNKLYFEEYKLKIRNNKLISNEHLIFKKVNE